MRNILKEIGTITRCINSISDINYKDINLQKGQFIFLIRVCENPGINQIDLSNLLKVDKTTTTKAIQKLIKVGYIERMEDSSDKRMWRLYPLEKAKDTYAYITESENKSNQTYYDNFTKEEEDLLYELLKRLRQNIESDWAKAKKIKL
jgi:DNA-binding MarR family transcriptional regulator